MSAGTPNLTYSELPTISKWIECAPPYSFYFDLIGSFWKAPYSPLSLHRLCTLARKQNATFVIVESAHGRPDILEELSALDASCGSGGAAEAVKLTFVKSTGDKRDAKDLIAKNIIG